MKYLQFKYKLVIQKVTIIVKLFVKVLYFLFGRNVFRKLPQLFILLHELYLDQIIVDVILCRWLPNFFLIRFIIKLKIIIFKRCLNIKLVLLKIYVEIEIIFSTELYQLFIEVTINIVVYLKLMLLYLLYFSTEIFLRIIFIQKLVQLLDCYYLFLCYHLQIFYSFFLLSQL